MKAAVLFGKGDLKIAEFPDPKVKDDDVLVAVSYCGICGTDLHKFAGHAGSRPVVYPVPLGHEISGVVKEVGKNVTRFKPGDRVTVDPNHSCGKCDACRRGQRNMCEASRGVVKGMAEYVSAPEENVYHLPDGMSLRDASLTEPLSCCLHGLDQLDLKCGQTVALIGLGAIGTMMLQLLRRIYGVRVIAIDAIEEKRTVAADLGAELFVNSATENVKEAIAAAGIGNVDRVLECVGLPVTAELALSVAGRGATVVLFGVGSQDSYAKLGLYEMFSKELTIKASYVNPDTSDRAIAILSDGFLDTDKIISRVIDLDEAPEEIATRKYVRYGKVVVRVFGE